MPLSTSTIIEHKPATTKGTPGRREGAFASPRATIIVIWLPCRRAEAHGSKLSMSGTELTNHSTRLKSARSRMDEDSTG